MTHDPSSSSGQHARTPGGDNTSGGDSASDAESTAPAESARLVDPEPRWPNVLGIVALLVGTMGVVAYGCCGGGFLFIQPFLDPAGGEPLTAVERELLQAQQEVNRRFFLWMLFNALASTALSIFLMVGGLSLLRREGWAPTALTTWAAIRTLHAPLVAIMVLLQGRAHWAARIDVLQQMGEPIPHHEPLVHAWIWAVAIAVLVWGWILPAFMFIWFRLPHVRDEVRTWKAGRPLRL